MAKFYGGIGYAELVEAYPGVWQEKTTVKKYYGDVIKDSMSYRNGENLNDNLIINNRFSIIADPYAYENFHAMRYVEWMGSLWKISSVEVQRPRLVISIGGVYNEQQST